MKPIAKMRRTAVIHLFFLCIVFLLPDFRLSAFSIYYIGAGMPRQFDNEETPLQFPGKSIIMKI